MRLGLRKIDICVMMFEIGYTVLSMEDGQPSFTALTAAAARAAHLVVDQEPWIFADTLAAALLGERAEELISYHKLQKLVMVGKVRTLIEPGEPIIYSRADVEKLKVEHDREGHTHP